MAKEETKHYDKYGKETGKTVVTERADGGKSKTYESKVGPGQYKIERETTTDKYGKRK